MKVVFATPSISGPTAPYIAALKASIPLIKAAGWEEGYAQEIGNPYISMSRSLMTRRALDAKADIMVYIDYDLSWEPEDLLTLLETEGDVVAGDYRFKKDEEEYMAVLLTDKDGNPKVKEHGFIYADRVPAGFLKVSKEAINKFMTAYPELCYGEKYNLSVDLFNHGAHKGVWYGEDYAFSRNWRDCGGQILVVADLNISHHSKDTEYKGNLHEFLMKQPGGSNHEHE